LLKNIMLIYATVQH